MKKLLSNKMWISLLISDLISNFGDILFYLALMNYVLLLPDPKYAISIITLSESLPPLIAIFTGYIADKSKNNVQKIVGTQLFRVFLYILVGIVIGYTPALWVVIVISFLNFLSDLAANYENGLYIPITLKLISNDLREQSMAFSQTAKQISQIVFKSISAILVTIMSYKSLAFVNAATFGVSALIMIIISKGLRNLLTNTNLENSEQKQSESEKQHFLKSFKDSGKSILNSLKEDKEIYILVLIAPLFNAIFSLIHPLYALTISEYEKFIIMNIPTTLAIVSIVMTISSIIGSILSMSLLKNKSLYFIVKMMCLFGITTFTSIFILNIYLFLVNFGLLIMFVSALQPKLNARVFNALPKENLGMLAGFLSTYVQSSIFLISAIFSIVVTFLSVKMIVLFLILLFILISILYTQSIKNKK